MPVKPSQSGARMLSALEKISEHQPIGVIDLAREMGENVPATQRAIATLEREGWIKTANAKRARWELTARVQSIAQRAYSNNDLRRRARPLLEELWRETEESVLLNVPEGGKFVVFEVLESPQFLRTVAPVGLIVPSSWSATGRAMLPFMSLQRQAEFIGHPPDDAMLADFVETAERGYVISKGGVIQGSTNIAAPVFEADGEPVAAVLISAPNDRVNDAEYEHLGALVLATARRISCGEGTLQLGY